MKNQQMLCVGNFNNRTNPICTTPQRTDTYPLSGLDPPLLLYLPRLVIRTFLRLFLRLRPGCVERFGEIFFPKDSIIWWCLSNHWITRKRNQDMMQQIGLGIGRDVERRRMRRIGGWGSELKQWLSNVQKMVDSRKANRD